MLESDKEQAEDIERVWGPKFGELPPPRDFELLRKLAPRFVAKKLATIPSPSPELMSQALKLCGNSAPGPSLLTFAVFRRILALASVILAGASCALEDELVLPPFDFHISYLVLLLKKKYEEVKDVGIVAYTRDLRTISISNSETRAIYKPWAMILTPLCNSILSPAQTINEGTLPNIIETQTLYQKEREKSSAAGLCFLDVGDAFPSMAHDYLLRCLRCWGMREGVLRVISRHLSNMFHIIRVNGYVLRGVYVRSGIPQGERFGYDPLLCGL